MRPKINHTLDTLRAHCDIVGNCWLWRNVKTPPAINQNGTNTNARRFARELSDGTSYPASTQIVGTCGNYNCIAPHCTAIKQITLKKQGRNAAQLRTNPATPFTGLGARS